jgi:hypothetical protein
MWATERQDVPGPAAAACAGAAPRPGEPWPGEPWPEAPWPEARPADEPDTPALLVPGRLPPAVVVPGRLAPGLAPRDAELPEAEASERAVSWPEAPDARAPGPAG